jgi:sulfate/thiosulfate transport system permease protein
MHSPVKRQWKHHSVLPGFGLTMGFSLLYLSLIVLLPLAALFLKSSTIGWSEFWGTIRDPQVVSAYKLTFVASFIAAAINAFFGLIVTWVLVRYSFPGKKLVDAMVDLPFAMPTAVSGIALTAIYAPNGWIGHYLMKFLGLRVAYTPLGIMVALTFIGLPFVVRTLQPALEDMEAGIEEAAASLGATRLQTFFRVIFPSILPALLTGFALAFARALGEYGSVVFISGNQPMKTQIVPQIIMGKLDEFRYEQAAAVAVVMLAASFVILLIINFLQWLMRRFTS